MAFGGWPKVLVGLGGLAELLEDPGRERGWGGAEHSTPASPDGDGNLPIKLPVGTKNIPFASPNG